MLRRKSLIYVALANIISKRLRFLLTFDLTSAILSLISSKTPLTKPNPTKMKTQSTRITKATRRQWFFDRMSDLGFSREETDTLRRIEMTLHRWAEQECGDGNDHASWAIERDETTLKPYMVLYPHSGPSRRHPIADRENGALRRAKAILDSHPELWMYQQTDPRGCALYVGRKSDLREGERLDSVYTRGVAVCVD